MSQFLNLFSSIHDQNIENGYALINGKKEDIINFEKLPSGVDYHIYDCDDLLGNKVYIILFTFDATCNEKDVNYVLLQLALFNPDKYDYFEVQIVVGFKCREINTGTILHKIYYLNNISVSVCGINSTYFITDLYESNGNIFPLNNHYISIKDLMKNSTYKCIEGVLKRIIKCGGTVLNHKYLIQIHTAVVWKDVSYITDPDLKVLVTKHLKTLEPFHRPIKRKRDETHI